MKSTQSPEKIFIRTFGGLTVYRHHSPVVISWESQKARLLFCYLLITSDQWVHRDQLLELLWPGCDHESGSKNFKTTLSRLRKSFQGARNLNPDHLAGMLAERSNLSACLTNGLKRYARQS